MKMQMGVLLIKPMVKNLVKLCFAMMVCSATAAPVPVDQIYCDPGFESTTTTNRQTVTYVEIDNEVYLVTGATCTSCPIGTRAGTTNDVPVSNTDALSGAVITHAVLNISTGLTSGAKFDLGMTVTNDNIGIVLGEIGTSSQTGDPISVYPLTNGVRVGSWVRRIESSDYGKFADKLMRLYYNNYSTVQSLCPFVTVFRHGDFTNDTGSLIFDGIEINDTLNYDPNIVATINETSALAPFVTNKLPVTAMTFSPGFVDNVESNGQTLTSVTTDEGTFSNLVGLTCTSAGGSKFGAENEGVPVSTISALSGLKFTQGTANIDTGIWTLDVPVDGTDSSIRFFFGEICIYNSLTPDSVTINPYIGGVLDSIHTLIIKSGDYGNPSPTWDNTYFSYFKGVVVSFSLADFLRHQLDEPLTNVTGFRVISDVADPNIFGMYVVPTPPPPGTIILVY